MAYRFIEKDLNKDQYNVLQEQRAAIEYCVSTSAIKNLDGLWLSKAADIHVQVYGGPRPNIKSNGLPILFLLKQLLNKIKKYEATIATISPASRPIDRASIERRKEHFRRR